MPNWVRNVITVPKRIMPKIKEKYFVNDEFTFNKVIPMPKELMITSGSVTNDSIAYTLSKMKLIDRLKILNSINDLTMRYDINNKEDIEKLEKYAEKFEPTEDEKALGIKTLQDFGKLCINNYRKYGAFNWYNWSVENWGTKWDASFIASDASTISIDTAWDPPIPIIEKLSREFPEDKIVLEYADEDMYGPNKGKIAFINGKEIYDRELDIDEAKEIWGYEDGLEEQDDELEM